MCAITIMQCVSITQVRRMAGRQLRRGVDVERVFSQYDIDSSGTLVRADFVQVCLKVTFNLGSFHTHTYIVVYASDYIVHNGAVR
jgi:hypothetical protein